MHRAYLHVLADADRILAIPHVDTIFHCATAGYYGLLLDGKCAKLLHALEDGSTVQLPAIKFKLDSELGECTQAKASGRRRGRKGRGSGRGRGRSADTTALVTIPKGPKNLKLKLKHKSKKKNHLQVWKSALTIRCCPFRAQAVMLMVDIQALVVAKNMMEAVASPMTVVVKARQVQRRLLRARRVLVVIEVIAATAAAATASRTQAGQSLHPLPKNRS